MLRKTFSRPFALIIGASLLLVGGGSALALAATDPASSAIELASADSTPTSVLAEGVLVGATSTGAYRAPEAPEPVVDPPASPAPSQAPAPAAEPVVEAPAAQATGELGLPTIGFSASVTEEVSPVRGVLKPSGEGLARAVEVPGLRASLLLVHSGPEGLLGNLLAPRDGEPTVRAGDPAILEDGSLGVVLHAEVIGKRQFSSVDLVRDALRNPSSTVLVSCRRDSDSPERSPDNIVIVLGRA